MPNALARGEETLEGAQTQALVGVDETPEQAQRHRDEGCSTSNMH